MKKKLTKGKNANYEISITVDTAEYTKAEEKAVKHFQKDFELPGFRKGAVPIHLVKEKVRPEYLTIGVYEEIINTGLQQIIQENTSIRFIGEPYDINQDKKEDETTLTLKLDIYPTVDVKNDKWSKLTIPALQTEPTQEEIDKAMMQLKKNYADYQDADTVAEDTVSKIHVTFVDKDGNDIHSTNTFVGEQEYAEDKFYTTTFVGKKKDEEFVLSYNEKKQPHSFHLHKEGVAKPTQIKLKTIDIKKIVYPTFDEAMLQKLFGNESTVKNEADLLVFIKQTLVEQKAESELVKAVEHYIQTVKKESMEVEIPQTMINEEYKVRLQNLAQRFGGDQKKMQEYLTRMGEDQSKKFLDDIKKASGESLEKFFILRQVVEELKIEVNREKPEKLEIEHKLYDKLSHKEEKEKKNAKKK